LFNAEEQGLVGSKVYARQQKSIGAPIVAVFQMDMIAYNQASPRAWEVHAGFSSSREVEKRSVALARLLADLVPTVAPQLTPPQIYQSGRGTDGAVDPAEGRSDHAPFQMHGYAACVASEDFFVGPTVESPTPEENPHYHQKTDTFVDPDFATDITRVIAAAAWVTAQGSSATPVGPRPARAFAHHEERTRMSRELDTRKVSNDPLGRPLRVVTGAATRPSAVPSARTRLNALTATPVTVRPTVPPAEEGSVVDKALAFLRTEKASFGFTDTDVTEFVPDPIVQRTSTGSAAVHVHQYYRGLPVFQMTRTVRFAPQGQVVDAPGDNAPLPEGLDIEPKLEASAAVLKAAQHLANTGAGETRKTRFQETVSLPTVDIDDFSPSVLASFPLPSRPTVFDKGPFENPIPAHLLIFNQPQGPRLSWHTVLTFPDYEDQYVVIVSADEAEGEILYCKSTVHRMLGQGNVYEFSPGVSDRRMIDFPRPLTDYPAMPTTPLADFPRDWITDKQTIGNSTRATLGVSTKTLTGTLQNGRRVFNPADAVGDEQKILNIFYFCSYMHDFLYILGFDEAAGNFQSINFTHTGLGNDPVRARAHHGTVRGTANMATGPDGQPPVMNMGLVADTNRHTAFDADVVFHEYTHGLTHRLVGGRMNAQALDEPQSAGMGEGWSDYFALTMQSFFLEREKVVTGDWVVNRPGGIRNAPYDDDYPFTYGDIANFTDEHDAGEVWCAALMMMTRKLRQVLDNDREGYRLGWQMVADGLKLTQANPSFLDARDAILLALDQLKQVGRLPAATYKQVRRASWEAFAHFGMGINASSNGASLDGIVADTTLPTDL
jgi:extracellular elastinolytic metalloproteinase